MNAALAACGPDGSGLWLDGPVGIGQRLSCFTPEDRHERLPLVDAERRQALTWAGRLDGRADLERALSLAPAEAANTPDSVLFLRAYWRWGPACLDTLTGDFTFALWDGNARRLLLGRSPFGGRAVFYHAASGVFAFASMPRGLHALPFVERALDERKLAALLVHDLSEIDRSLYRGISILPGGHLLAADADGVRLRRCWRLDLGHELHYSDDEAYQAAFGELFERVVRDQLRSLTPVGSFMSGGLDSSSVAATAARLLAPRGERLAAFTEVPRPGSSPRLPRGWYADETPLVQAVAAMHPGLDLHLIRSDERGFFFEIERFFAHAELPFPNTFNRIWMEAIMAAAADRGIRVLLTGDQGNLTISWPGEPPLPRLLRAGQWRPAWVEVERLVASGQARSRWRALVGQGLQPLAPAWLRRRVRRIRGLPDEALDRWRAGSPISHALAAAYPARKQRISPGDLRLMRHHLLYATGIGGSLEDGYRAMFRLDLRVPTLDARLVRFCFALPEEQFQRDGVRRRLIRRAMVGQLPLELLANERRGMQCADWFERLTGERAEIVAELARLVQSPQAARALNLPALQQLVGCWPADDQDDAVEQYMVTLAPGLMVGRFLRWFESGIT